MARQQDYMQRGLSLQWVLIINNNNMGHSNGIITAPISTNDVRLTIGENSHDVGTLCTSAKINKWPKHKPVRNPGFYYQDIDSLKSSYVPDWWKGSDKNCGLRIFDADPYHNMLQCVNGMIANPTLINWEYLPPRGGYEPYRLTDFSGYNHNPHPAILLSGAPTTLSPNSVLNFSVFFVLSQAQQDAAAVGNLTLADLNNISIYNLDMKNMYLGICFTNVVNYQRKFIFAISDETVLGANGTPNIYASQASIILGNPTASAVDYDVYYNR